MNRWLGSGLHKDDFDSNISKRLGVPLRELLVGNDYMNRSGRHDQCQTPAVELGRIASRDDLSLLTTGKKMETSVINQLIDRFVRRHGACGSKPSAGKQALRDASAEGYEIIKIYNKLDLLTITQLWRGAQLHMP